MSSPVSALFFVNCACNTMDFANKKVLTMTHPQPRPVADHSKKISQSDLYKFASQVNLVEFLEPDIAVKMGVEHQIDTDIPRTEKDGDSTRIFVNYVNRNKRSILYTILDDQRLDRQFDIDHFLDGYTAMMNFAEDNGNDQGKIVALTTSALNLSIFEILGLSPDSTRNSKEVSSRVFPTLLSILLNDPLDAVLVVEEVPNPKEGHPGVIISRMWTIKKRVASDNISSTDSHSEPSE